MNEWRLERPLELVVAGFGGQGVMMIGQLVTYAGMAAGKHVSWIPSYGPEMRGGTANCGVIVAEEPIGSPLVTEPNGAVILNAPSLDKFEPLLAPGAAVVVNSSMVPRRVQRTDVAVAYAPATEIALQLGNQRVVSTVMLGAFLELAGAPPVAAVQKVLGKLIRAHLIDLNVEAIEAGRQAVRTRAEAAL